MDLWVTELGISVYEKHMGFLSVNLTFSHSCLFSQQHMSMPWSKMLFESPLFHVMASPMTSEKKSLFSCRPKATIIIIDHSPVL